MSGIVAKKDDRNWWAIIIFIALILAIAAPIIYVITMDYQGHGTAEMLISPLLVIGVVALLITLTFMTSIFHYLGLADKNQTLGLPEGSIRAVIALSLILIFMISSVFIYNQMSSEKTEISNGITKDMLHLFQNESIAYIKQTNTKNNEPIFEVARIRKPNAASEDLAKQIITTVSTLVIAIAGFYFGTKAVLVASGATAISDPLIRSIDPIQGRRGENIQFKIFGKNFEIGAEGKVKLVRGNIEIPCTDILSNPTEITCRFFIPKDNVDVDSKWSVVVTNTDKGEDKFEDAFTILSDTKTEEEKAEEEK